MTLLTWMKRANSIKVRHESKTKREKKEKRKKKKLALTLERKESNSRLDKIRK